MELSRDQLVKLFEYKDGHLFHKPRTAEMFKNGVSGVNQWNSRCAGKLAGAHCKTNGYVQLVIKNPWTGEKVRTSAHRLIWVLFNGDIPSDMQIDHKNGNRSDNRIENLRVVTLTENARNRGISKNNTSGVLGVCWDKSRDKWQVVTSGKFIGYFDDKEKAALARQTASASLAYHENHGKRGSHGAEI